MLDMEGCRTDITYDENGKIIQLDTYIAEIPGGDAFIGIDLALFTQKHPLRGGIKIDHHIGEVEQAYVIDVINGDDDILATDDEIEDLTLHPDSLIINQHVGRIGVGGITVAASTYNIEEARKTVVESIRQMTLVETLLSDYSNNVH